MRGKIRGERERERGGVVLYVVRMNAQEAPSLSNWTRVVGMYSPIQKSG